MIGGVCRTLGSLGEGFGERGRRVYLRGSDLMASVGQFFIFRGIIFDVFFGGRFEGPEHILIHVGSHFGDILEHFWRLVAVRGDS